MKTALVTGATGHLGNVLVRELLREGFAVKVLVLPNDPLQIALRGLPVMICYGNVLDKKSLFDALEGVQVVFHLAAKILLAPDKDRSVWQINVEGTRNVANLCLAQNIERFIHCSSHHALQHKPYHLPFDEQRPLALHDRADYHRAKAQAEALILDLVGKGLNAVIVSPGTLIGPYDYQPSIFAKALIDFYSGKIPVLMEGLSDYADVRDVAQGIIAAYRNGSKGERYLLTGWMLSMRDLPALIEQVTGKKMPTRVLPLWVMYMLLPFIKVGAWWKGIPPLFTREMLEASQSNPDVRHEKAAQAFGFQPRSLQESFQDAFAWYKAQGWIKE